MSKKAKPLSELYKIQKKLLFKKYKRLRTRYFLLFTFPIALITIGFQVVKEILKQRARNEK